MMSKVQPEGEYEIAMDRNAWLFALVTAFLATMGVGIISPVVPFNQLTSLPLEFWQLRNLQRLYLNENKLAALPSEIGQLVNLRELYLSDNELVSLPPEIRQLINLRELNLSHNQLTSLPPALCEKLRDIIYLPTLCP